MKKLLCFAAMFLFVGCSKHKQITGGSEGSTSEDPKPKLFLVSCCRDNNAGQLTYPAYVPASHVQFCEEVRDANRNDRTINGDLYLAMSSECGTGRKHIGDEYYEGNGSWN